jgi:hypothetical protein
MLKEVGSKASNTAMNQLKRMETMEKASYFEVAEKPFLSMSSQTKPG